MVTVTTCNPRVASSSLGCVTSGFFFWQGRPVHMPVNTASRGLSVHSKRPHLSGCVPTVNALSFMYLGHNFKRATAVMWLAFKITCTRPPVCAFEPWNIVPPLSAVISPMQPPPGPSYTSCNYQPYCEFTCNMWSLFNKSEVCQIAYHARASSLFSHRLCACTTLFSVVAFDRSVSDRCAWLHRSLLFFRLELSNESLVTVTMHDLYALWYKTMIDLHCIIC